MPPEDGILDLSVNIIPMLIEIMEHKDQDTMLHSSRVQKVINDWIPALKKKRVITEEDTPLLWVSSILHDIGKIFVQDEVLGSRNRLSETEFEHIRNHPTRGYKLLCQIEISPEILAAVRHHHERWDGRKKGPFPAYPDGLKGRKIPLFARIISIADTFDALISERPYKKALSRQEALRIIRSNSRKQFDPGLVRIFLGAMRSVANRARP